MTPKMKKEIIHISKLAAKCLTDFRAKFFQKVSFVSMAASATAAGNPVGSSRGLYYKNITNL